MCDFSTEWITSFCVMSTFPCSLPRDCRYFEVSASMMNMTNDPRSKAVIHWRLLMLLSWSPRAHLYVVGMLRFMFWHKPTELAHSLIFCSCVYFCLYGPFNCISFHKFSRQPPCFHTLFFRSNFCLIGPFNYMSLCVSFLQPSLPSLFILLLCLFLSLWPFQLYFIP